MLARVGLALVMVIGTAHADPEPAPPPSTPPRPVYVPVYGAMPTPNLPPPREHDYGWKIAISDGVALGIVLLAVSAETPSRSSDSDSLGLSGSAVIGLLGIAWWSTVTPLVHLTERNGSGAVLSYGARYVLPLAGALIGHTFDRPDSTSDGGALAGICVGALAASAIDIMFLAHRTEHAGNNWMPMFSASSGGYRMGLGRSF